MKREAIAVGLALAVVAAVSVAAARAKETPAPRRVTEDASLTCPNVLGIGVGSRLQFCDVLTGRDPAGGVLVHLPPHRGVLTLTFDLHNRHTYSEAMERAGKAYAGYTATIGVLTMDGTLLGRGVVRSEFRTARDMLDRIGGGAGPRGYKAVVPVGTERISIDVPQKVDEVSLLGERLTVVGRNGTQTFVALGRPIATVSRVVVDYVPAPKPAPKRPVRKK